LTDPHFSVKLFLTKPVFYTLFRPCKNFKNQFIAFPSIYLSHPPILLDIDRVIGTDELMMDKVA